MTKKLIHKIIKRMESEGFKIRGVVCDMGNPTFNKQFDMKNLNHFFKNPADETRNVYIFPDVPHLIKLARNHLFDKGFLVPDKYGKLVYFSRSDYEKLMAADSVDPLSDFKICHKLTTNHLYCKSSMRQNVSLATQIFSRTCAKAFLQNDVRRGVPNGIQNAEAKHDATMIFDEYFDVMNSGHLADKRPLSCALGNRNVVQRQFEVLRNMENFLDTFMINGKDPDAKELPWIQGIRISIKSTRALYVDVVKKGNFAFLKTKSLNQDCLENLFSRIRGMFLFSGLMIFKKERER